MVRLPVPLSVPVFTFAEQLAACDLCGGTSLEVFSAPANIVRCQSCGYRWKEVPVRITYAGGKKPYTRARPVVDWWGYFRPVLLLRLGLRR